MGEGGTSRDCAVGDVHGDIKLVTVEFTEGIQAAIDAFKEPPPSVLTQHAAASRSEELSLIGDKLSADSSQLTR